MRRFGLLVVACALAGASVSFAQDTPGPNLVLSISGGMTTADNLWTIPRQLMPVATPANEFDTLALGRRIRPGLTALFGAIYHPSPAFGYMIEVGYFGIASEGRCAPIGGYRVDADQNNQKACEATQGAHYSTSAIGFQAGAVYRVAPRAFLSPYARATAGIASLGTSFIETSSRITSTDCPTSGVCEYTLLRERDRKDVTWTATLAAGMTIAASSGYQLRLEARDLIISLPVVTGPAPSAGADVLLAPTAMRTRHIFTLTVGLDVVLERRHRRRY